MKKKKKQFFFLFIYLFSVTFIVCRCLVHSFWSVACVCLALALIRSHSLSFTRQSDLTLNYIVVIVTKNVVVVVVVVGFFSSSSSYIHWFSFFFSVFFKWLVETICNPLLSSTHYFVRFRIYNCARECGVQMGNARFFILFLFFFNADHRVRIHISIRWDCPLFIILHV